MDTRHRHLLKIGLLANSFEWYEYSIFGFLASLMGQLFFQSSHSMVSLIQGWTLFATSYLARPLGALFFGLLSHRIGHGLALRISLLLMAIPTCLMGLLPSYEQAGWVGGFFLINLRLIQGFAAGGELPNSGCYVFETASPRHRSLLCSALVASGPIGMLLGSFVTTILMRYFTHLEQIRWAWRFPFLLSIPLTLFIAYVRQKMIAPASKGHSKVTSFHFPSLSEWKLLGLPLLRAGCLVSFETICFYLLFIWMPTYTSYFVGIPSDTAHLVHSIAIGIALPFYFIGGYYSKHFGYHRLVIAGTIGMFVMSVPILYLLSLSKAWYQLLALQTILLWICTPMHSAFAEMLIRLFPQKVRSVGVSLAWSIPPAYIGSTTPLVCSYMINKTGLMLFPAFYIMIFACIALPVALKLEDTSVDK